MLDSAVCATIETAEATERSTRHGPEAIDVESRSRGLREVKDMRIRRCSGIVLPVLIVAAGIVLLLNTTGVLEWSAWSELGRLWPIAVILFGASILWNRFRDRV